MSLAEGGSRESILHVGDFMKLDLLKRPVLSLSLATVEAALAFWDSL